MNEEVKWTGTETTPTVAFELGCIDALTGRPNTRYLGGPYTGDLPIPKGTISLTETEAAAIDEIREQYQMGYQFAEAENAEIVAFARARPRRAIIAIGYRLPYQKSEDSPDGVPEPLGTREIHDPDLPVS